MDDEKTAAFVISQSVCAMITAMGMQAENQAQKILGMSPVYGEGAFQQVILNHGIGHNDVLTTLHNIGGR